MQFLVLLQQLHVCTTTFKTILEFDFILDDQCLVRVVDRSREFSGDGMMGSRILDDQSFVANNTGKDSRLFDRPFTNVGPVFVTLGVFLLRMRRSPSQIPVVGELF